jgi:hypothetical protein
MADDTTDDSRNTLRSRKFWGDLEAEFSRAADKRPENRDLVARWHHQCGWTFATRLPGCTDRRAIDRFKALARIADGGPSGKTKPDGWGDWLDALREYLSKSDREGGSRGWKVTGLDPVINSTQISIEHRRIWEQGMQD